MRRKRQLYCAPAYCGLVPKMEKLGVRSSKRRHQSSSQTDVSLSVVVAVKLVIQMRRRSTEKKTTTKSSLLCVWLLCWKSETLPVCMFSAGGWLVKSACSIVETGLIVHNKRNLSYCVEGRFRKGEKRDKTQSLQFIILFTYKLEPS